jgi:hypothetical protein
VQIAVGLAVAIAGGVAAVAFMAFASPAAAPGSQGASAVGGADMDPGVQLPGPSGNATGDPPLPAPAPGLPTPSLPSLPS